MSNVVTVSDNRPVNSDGGVWFEGTRGERIAVRISSIQTNGAYAVVESVAQPDCATPMHLHRNEEEHLIVISGLYRVALEDRVFDMSPGTSITIPKGARHSWRNLNSEPSHLLVILTPGGFERCIQTIRNYPPEKLEEVAASFGCYIVGSPVSLACSPRSLQQLVFGPILDEVRQFSTHQPQDDITLIVAKCKGNQNRSRLCAESGICNPKPL